MHDALAVAAHLGELSLSEDPQSSFDFSPDGSQIVTLGASRIVHLWDSMSGRELGALPGKFRGVDFSADGQRIATYSEDGFVHLWDSKSREPIAVLRANILSPPMGGGSRMPRTNREPLRCTYGRSPEGYPDPANTRFQPAAA
jgi:WD40 repeat protein